MLKLSVNTCEESKLNDKKLRLSEVCATVPTVTCTVSAEVSFVRLLLARTCELTSIAAMEDSIVRNMLTQRGKIFQAQTTLLWSLGFKMAVAPYFEKGSHSYCTELFLRFFLNPLYVKLSVTDNPLYRANGQEDTDLC